MLQEEGKRFPWIYFVAVCAEGGTVKSTLPKKTAASYIEQLGGCVGFAGIIWFNKRLVIFTRPLKAGDRVQKMLVTVADKLEAFAEECFRQEIQKRMDTTMGGK
jgi:hypothetical protein